MADLSKIKLNGNTYNFKDGWARDNLQTASQVNTAINNALGNISGFSIEVVESLPATGEQGIFYFVSNFGSGNNIYDEYVYVNDAFEKIGTTEVNLSNYLQKTEIADWAKAANKPSYTASEVGAMSTSHAANAITSANITAWNNKSDFSGSYNDLEDKPNIPNVLHIHIASDLNDGYTCNYTYEEMIEAERNNDVITASDEFGNLAIRIGSTGPSSFGITLYDPYNYTIKEYSITSSTIQKVSEAPLNISQFTNDAGYLTSYTETDPTVPAWAKATNKPTYTAAEVGAIATTHAAAAITATDISNWNAKSDFSGSYNDLTNKPTIPAATTVTNTLSSGILIATINGTNIYAPSYTNGDNLAYGGE